MKVRIGLMLAILAAIAPASPGQPAADAKKGPILTEHFKVYYTDKASMPHAQTLAPKLEKAFKSLQAGAGAAGKHLKLAASTLDKLRNGKRIRVGVRDYKGYHKNWPVVVAIASKNFRIQFFIKKSSPQYALRILGYLEHAHSILFGKLKFEGKRLMKVKTDVWIWSEKVQQKTGNPGAMKLDVTYASSGPSEDRRVLVPTLYLAEESLFQSHRPDIARREKYLRTTCAHEFFHAIQEAYDIDWRLALIERMGKPATYSQLGAVCKYSMKRYLAGRWLSEGTARWVEGVVVPHEQHDWRSAYIPLGRNQEWCNYGYLMEMRKWFSSGDSEGPAMEKTYGMSAAFFQHLTETGDTDAVLRIWTRMGKLSEPALKTVIDVLGGKAEFGRKFGDFTAAVFVFRPSRDRKFAFADFDRLMNATVAKKLTTSLNSYPSFPLCEELELNGPSFKPKTNRLAVQTLDVRKLAVRYLAASPSMSVIYPKGGARGDAVLPEMTVAVRGLNDDCWQFSVIEVPPSEGGPWKTHRLGFAPGEDKYRLLRVPNVGGSVGQVVVAGANTDDEEKFEYAFMLSPPIFTRIEVRTKVGGTDKLVWAIGRTRQSDGTWSRRIAPVEGVLSDVDSKARVEFTVTASRSMGQIRLRVRNGGKWEEVRLKSVSKTLRVRRGEISLARLRGFLSGRPAGNVRIRLRGEDVNDIRIDPDPETPAKLNPDLTVTGWEGITDADGGWEEHDIPVGFNEVWEETNLLNNETTTFVVSRQGDSLKAVNPMYVYDGKKTGANVSLDFEFRKVPQMAGKRWYSNGRRIASPSTAIVRKLFADHAGKLSIGYRMKEISPTEMRGTFESFQIEYRDGVLGDFTPRSTMWNVVWRKKKPAPTGSTPKTP